MALPLDSITFFTDRVLGRHDVPESLRRFGLTVEIQQDHFESDCEDHVWITEVGKRGWIILTKDKQIRSRQIEIAALMRSDTATFVLTNANTSGPKNAETFIKAMPKIFELIKRIKKPFLATITPAGDVALARTHEMMIEKYLSLAQKRSAD